MTDPIYNTLLHCIKEEGLLPLNAPRLKVALIGEYPGCHVLKYRLMEEYNVVITEFTYNNLFTVEDGKGFDVLIGCRPCEGARLILESATKYNKHFILLPCLCEEKDTVGYKPYGCKIVNFIREFPIITHSCNCVSMPYYGYPKLTGWIILYNV